MSRQPPSPPSLSESDSVFAALGHEARRHILLLLSHFGPELPSGYLASRLNHSWPTTTRHLHVLEEAGLVTVRREGRNIVYRLERNRLHRTVAGWLTLLETPTSKQTWRSTGPRTAQKEPPHE